jgi:hypothetical protein
MKRVDGQWFRQSAWWWQAGFPYVRAQRRAVDWLLDQGLIDHNAAEKLAADHRQLGLP